MKYAVAIFLALILLAVFTSCATANFSRAVESISLGTQLNTEETLNKAIPGSKYQQNNTIYGMSKDWQMIHFYRDQRRVNSIGGLGTQNTNFQRLSDIAVAPDGNLLALDSVARKIRKYSSEGMYLGEIELRDTQQPELLAQSADQTLYVYDALSGELICYSPLDNSEHFRFGKFQLYRISNLSVGRSFVVAYSAADNNSYIYSALGQFIKTEKGQWLYDEYDNPWALDMGILRQSELHYSIGQMAKPLLSYGLGTLVISSANSLVLLHPQYERRR